MIDTTDRGRRMQEPLGNRELEAVRLTALGWKPKAIAAAMGVATGAVQRYRRIAKLKWRVTSTEALVREAVTQGVVSLQEANEGYFDHTMQRDGTEREPLSARETEVVRLAALGLKDREIAKRMKVGKTTVEKHKRMAKLKWRLPTTTALVIEAVNAGLVPRNKVGGQYVHAFQEGAADE